MLILCAVAAQTLYLMQILTSTSKRRPPSLITSNELTKGEILAIVGAGGGLGHLGCPFAKALGLMVIEIHAREEGLALARDSGADIVIDARQEKGKVVGEVMEATNGMCADATVNVSDNAQAAALACAVTKMQYVLSDSILPRLDQS